MTNIKREIARKCREAIRTTFSMPDYHYTRQRCKCGNTLSPNDVRKNRTKCLKCRARNQSAEWMKNNR